MSHTLRELLDRCAKTRPTLTELAHLEAIRTLGHGAADLISWDDGPHINPYDDRLLGTITGSDGDLTVFYDGAREPGEPTLFITVPCAADPSCPYAYDVLHSLTPAYQVADRQPTNDPYCPAHDH